MANGEELDWELSICTTDDTLIDTIPRLVHSKIPRKSLETGRYNLETWERSKQMTNGANEIAFLAAVANNPY
jgi:hypothetical protein